jgi:hypothetical protein
MAPPPPAAAPPAPASPIFGGPSGGKTEDQ